MTLDELKNTLTSLTPEALFPYLANYFNQREVKELMVELNQEQLFGKQILNNGDYTPDYAPYTIEKRRKAGYSLLPTMSYHYHETGDLFRSMGVKVSPDSVEITAGSSNPDALGMDMGFGVGGGEQGHIESMFSLHDEERLGLGLTEENFAQLMEGVRDAMVQGIKESIDGTFLPF